MDMQGMTQAELTALVRELEPLDDELGDCRTCNAANVQSEGQHEGDCRWLRLLRFAEAGWLVVLPG